MSTPDCLTEDEIARFVDGRLTGESLARAEAHLAACGECMVLLAGVGNVLAGTAAPQEGADEKDGARLPAGERVGRYVIDGLVGAGAMGRVYAATDPSLDRRVALKVLHDRVASPDLEARLLREAKAMARLSHANVVTVHDAGRHGDRLFIAMEFVDGGTLRDWLRARRRTWREVLVVLTRAGSGLAAAHAAGVVHRDFKPDNVLVGDDGRVRVTDFGLARTGREAAPSDTGPANDGGDPGLTRTGTLLGTPAYMAPEQLAGHPADARSDVYGFCVSLYEALYGERPFPGQTLAELSAQKREGVVPPPKDPSGVPPRVRRAILVGLRPKPEDRYPSMDALTDALASAARIPRAILVLGVCSIAALVAGGAALARAVPRAARVTTTAAPGCTSDRACAMSHGGAPYVCRASDHACVAIASEDCTPYFAPGDLEDGTVWLGAMFPTKGEMAYAHGAMNLEGADLARAEISRVTEPLTGEGASSRVRRVALVGCDDGVDSARAARHLVEDVGVPAILGFGSGSEIEALAGSLLIHRGVVSVATLSGNPLVTRLPQPPDLPRMVWRTTYSIEASADAAVHFVHDALEPRARGREPTRVALARVDASMGAWFGKAFFRDLTFNDRPAVANGDAYQEVTFAPGAEGDELARVASRITLAHPTILVLLGGTAETSSLAARVEAAWPAAVPRPIYFFAAESLEALAPFVGKDRDRRRRVFAVSSLSSQTSNVRFLMRFDAVHPGEATLTLNPSPSYDAFYLLAYAVFALGDAPVTGPSIARAFARLVPPGRPIETGPTDLFDALATLKRGEPIDVNGAAGSLDFDLASGESQTDFALLCPSIDRDGRATGGVESGLVYRTSAKAVTGQMRCP